MDFIKKNWVSIVTHFLVFMLGVIVSSVALNIIKISILAGITVALIIIARIVQNMRKKGNDE